MSRYSTRARVEDSIDGIVWVLLLVLPISSLLIALLCWYREERTSKNLSRGRPVAKAVSICSRTPTNKGPTLPGVGELVLTVTTRPADTDDDEEEASPRDSNDLRDLQRFQVGWNARMILGTGTRVSVETYPTGDTKDHPQLIYPKR